MSSIIGDIGQAVPGTVQSLLNSMMTALEKHYPTYKGYWHISLDTNGGIVQIRNLMLSGTMGFMMHIDRVDTEQRKLIKNAGELLERYNAARKHGIHLHDAMRDVKRNGIGEGIYDT